MVELSAYPDLLPRSRAWCEQLCRRSNSSFFYSFALLDRPRRQAMCALYAFARITDDLGDSTAPPAIRRQQLAGWRTLLFDRCPPAGCPSSGFLPIAGSSTVEPSTTSLPTACLPAEGLQPADSFADWGRPWEKESQQEETLASGSSGGLGLDEYADLWPALAEGVARYQIPIRLLEDIIRGVALDLHHVPPRSWRELQRYCHYVASSVGLCCVHIWRAGRETPAGPVLASVQDCGFAFQLTNILRDVAEDARMGRIYLPLCELEASGIDPQRWLSGHPNGRWPELIERAAEEARRRYDAGWQTIETLTPRSQRMFSLIWRSYRALLEQVVASKDELWSAPKIRLSRRQRLNLLAAHLLPANFSKSPPP
ncbi:MAG: squalene/phytoene synthase family protein [Planctomycetales bacterium]|nr:squalene/phytoene synthase family protein [Planctomycetales bacterium]